MTLLEQLRIEYQRIAETREWILANNIKTSGPELQPIDINYIDGKANGIELAMALIVGGEQAYGIVSDINFHAKKKALDKK